MQGTDGWDSHRVCALMRMQCLARMYLNSGRCRCLGMAAVRRLLLIHVCSLLGGVCCFLRHSMPRMRLLARQRGTKARPSRSRWTGHGECLRWLVTLMRGSHAPAVQQVVRRRQRLRVGMAWLHHATTLPRARELSCARRVLCMRFRAVRQAMRSLLCALWQHAIQLP